VRLLFVCTGNLCRSPVAERLAAARARDALGFRADEVHVFSAGLGAQVGQPMHPLSAKALVRLGGKPFGFEAQAFSKEMAQQADLVLTMTRRQRRAVLEQTPRGLRRTFTLLEAAGLLELADLDGLTRVPLEERAQELGMRLHAARQYRPGTEADDVLDPIGQSARVHNRVAARIAAALGPLTTALWGDVEFGATAQWTALAAEG
jgi:protein-tyrosine phosphatase